MRSRGGLFLHLTATVPRGEKRTCKFTLDPQIELGVNDVTWKQVGLRRSSVPMAPCLAQPVTANGSPFAHRAANWRVHLGYNSHFHATSLLVLGSSDLHIESLILGVTNDEWAVTLSWLK